QQPVANGLQCSVNAHHHGPYLAVLEGLRTLGQQLPDLSQLVIPGGQGSIEVAYDPAVTHGASPPFLIHSGTSDSGADDQVQDLFGKGDDDTAGQRQEALAALAGIMALQRQAHLNDAPAQQNQADGSDDGEDEGTEVVDNSQRIALGQHRRGGTADQNQSEIGRASCRERV